MTNFLYDSRKSIEHCSPDSPYSSTKQRVYHTSTMHANTPDLLPIVAPIDCGGKQGVCLGELIRAKKGIYLVFSGEIISSDNKESEQISRI